MICILYEGDSVTDWAQTIALIISTVGAAAWAVHQARSSAAEQRAIRAERERASMSTLYARWAAAAMHYIQVSAMNSKGLPLDQVVQIHTTTVEARTQLREAQLQIHLQETPSLAKALTEVSDRIDNWSGAVQDMDAAIQLIRGPIDARRRANFPNERTG